jgi:hypothetical protein
LGGEVEDVEVGHRDFLTAVERGVDGGEQVNGPSEQNDPTHGRQEEEDQSREDAALGQLAKAGEEEAAKGGDDVAG